MPGEKQNAYVSEEARLQAQRRMLAEKYGLGPSSDEEDDDGSGSDSSAGASDRDAERSAPQQLNAEGTQNSGSAPKPQTENDSSTDLVDGKRNAQRESDASGAVGNGASSNSDPGHVSITPVGSRGQRNSDESAPRSGGAIDDPAPSEAATYGEGSSIHEIADELSVHSQDDVSVDASNMSHVSGASLEQRQVSDAPQPPPPLTATSVPQEASPPPPSSWPGVVLADSSSGNKIFRSYVYDKSQNPESISPRGLRVTQVTVYSSQFVEGSGRKIAVNDKTISYAVGGHIRYILRTNAERGLLKGHLSAVTDMEFLSPYEKAMTFGPWSGCSVLGSVGEDGRAIIWRLLRKDDCDEGETSLKMADSIPIEHPRHNEGHVYSRIAFRPGIGSVIADNGVGVAITLLDPRSSDVRLVEMVKMDDDVLLRDKYLQGRNEVPAKDPLRTNPTAPVSACVWMDEAIVAVARGPDVCLWRFEHGTCVGRLPRTDRTAIHSLHPVEERLLLVTADNGRVLEFWDIGNCMAKTQSFELNQSISLFKKNDGEVSSGEQEPFHGVLAIDPAKQVIVVGNAKGHSLFALHYNQSAGAADTLTEIAVKQPILSISATPCARRVSHDSGRDSETTVDEVGLWCVQPRGIQMIHLQPRDCFPRSPIVSELYSSSGTRDASASTPKKAADPQAPKMLLSKPTEESMQRPPLQPVPKRPLNPKITFIKKSSPERTPEPNPETPPGSSNRPDLIKSNKETESDIADAVLEATRKVIEAFEESAQQRDAAENARVKHLIASVKGSTEKNLERYVNGAMKKPMANAIIPTVSKIVTDITASARKAEEERCRITQDLFAHALEKSGLVKSFNLACNEMSRQVALAVKESMTSKCNALIDPSVNNILETSNDITAVVRDFSEKVDLSSSIIASARANGARALEPEDIRATVTKKIEKGDINEAFTIVLNAKDLELVTWLCAQFDPDTFFETHQLDQISILALAQQLGQNLAQGDPLTTVDWLRELMYVLEPNDEDIKPVLAETVATLRDNLVSLQSKSDIVSQHSGLGKQLKTLILVLTTMTI